MATGSSALSRRDRAVVRPVAVPDGGHMHRGRVLYAEATRPMQSLYLASARQVSFFARRHSVTE